MRKLVLGLLGTLAATLAALATWLGAFTSVVVEEREAGPYTFVYRTMPGAEPAQVGALTDELAQTLRAGGIAPREPLDLFYPEGSAQPSEIGFAIASEDAPRVAAHDPSLHVRELPAQPALVARFPWRHPLSFVVGFFKVVPALTAARAARGLRDGPSYTVNLGDTILYVQPIVR